MAEVGVWAKVASVYKKPLKAQMESLDLMRRSMNKEFFPIGYLKGC